ncbi:MAG: WhiB family transcriptional regulator [Actinomycetota bacterium]
MSWRADAACRDTSPELFFPIGTTGQAIDQIEAAKQVCMGCTSQEPCLEFALASNQDSGVWGATSEEDRRHLRRTYLSRRR